MYWVGWDNGVTGSIAIITYDNAIHCINTPVKKCLNYTKTKRWINRIDIVPLHDWISSIIPEGSKEVFCLVERPMVNPGRFQATASALRALEATLIELEILGWSYEYIDSKEWQKAMLPGGLEKEELKKASLEVGRRLFPTIVRKVDADSLLIAEYARRKYGNKQR